jgi:tetratricopeptide (TPR) repeat protein
VLIQGRVDSARAANQDQWNPAQMFQSLYVSDRVRTLTASRSAILFIDETQVKLNAGAVLTVQQVKTTAGTSTTLNLLEGEGWFRTKNPSSNLTIRTARAAVAIRGTEINLVVRGNDTVLTVTEGAAELSNDAGAILVNAGEEGTATPGVTPTKRTLLNPEDAVQWVLYYPTRIAWHDLPASAGTGAASAGFDRLKAGDPAGAIAAFQPTVQTDPWSRVGTGIALRQLGNSTEARSMLAQPVASPEADVERRAELAAAALASGDAASARAELEATIAASPNALRPLVMLSELELTQNRKAEALSLARRAVAARPDSVAAHVAAAEAAQAAFDLPEARRHLDAAIAIDPTDVRALVDRARVRFGAGDTVGAREDADQASTRAANESQVRSLMGFIKLAAGDEAGARADFEAAIGRDSALGEPHLGLGLVNFRAKQYEDGLLEMLTATLLEPKVSLYQSYLGKAYYELGRFPEGLAALASAKRLDPRDPTPWLYSSFFLRDLNRHVDALDELRRAITLNDNRAVYRSRLLLDRDMATKNVSLARVYNQLGFSAWGAYEALNSLNADLTNASAHLFMADTYGQLPDRTQALSSELDQYFIYSPVNLNSFNNFAEYTSLFERPRNQVTVTQGGGERDYFSTVVRTQSGNQRFAHTAFVDYYQRNGSRPEEPDERVQGTFLGKVAFGPSSDLFVTLIGVKQEEGKDNNAPVLVGEFPLQVNVTEIVDNPDPTFTHTGDQADATLGFKRFWTPGSALTLTANAGWIGNKDANPDATNFACTDNPISRIIGQDLTRIEGQSNRFVETPVRRFNVQAQQASRFGRHQVLLGGDYSRRRIAFRCHDSITSAIPGLLPEPFIVDQESSAVQDNAGGYIRDDIEVNRRLHVTLGVHYVDGTYRDPLKNTPDFSFSRWNPYAGASIRLSRVTVVHAAAFRNTNADFIGSRIAPPTVAGFLFERNEFPTANRDEGDLAVQNTWSRSYLEARLFVQRTVAPAFTYVPPELEPYRALVIPPDADFRARGFNIFFNQIVTRRFSLFADEQYVRNDATLVDRRDNQVRLGLNYIHPSGIFARVSTRLLNQRFFNTPVVGLPESSYALTDADLSYEFYRKRFLLTGTIRNLFDRRFTAVIDGLSVEPSLPYRTAIVTLRWRL